MGAWAMVVAAGSSRRMGVDKLMTPLRGKEVLRRTLEALASFQELDGVALVCAPGAEDAMRERMAGWGLGESVRLITPGGDTRRASVLNGLRELKRFGPDIVMVHDGARPLVGHETLAACLRSAMEHGSGVAGHAVTDTLHRAQNGVSLGVEPRDGLMAVQTPQAFRFEELLKAHEAAELDGFDATDDAAIMLRAGREVRIVPANPTNYKVTYPRDLQVLEALIRQREGDMRVGYGYDVHRIVAGRKLVLGGVEIPWDRGLLGHSDADVLAHALIDAMLGAAGLGDIGRHFPDTDNAYLGISSMKLLARASSMIREQGYAVGNADMTIVAQAPKLAPHMPAMCAAIARALGVSEALINVKAKTTEGLGFEGSGEGMSAAAVVLLTSFGNL